MAETRQLHIDELDPDLKTRLVAEAEESGVSINDLAVGILAEHHGVRFVGTGRPSRGAAGGAGLQLPVPQSLWLRIHNAAGKTGRSKREYVEAIFRARYERAEAAA
jgi:hypothetical protein